MIDHHRIIDIAERANDARPFCPCGWHTTLVWRDGAIWLECASLHQPAGSRLSRLISSITALAHVHERIVDAPAESPEIGLGAAA